MKFLIESLKHFLLCNLFLFFFVRHPHFEKLTSDNSYESTEEESDTLGSGSRSAGKFGTGLGGLLRGVGLTLGVTFSADVSGDGEGGSFVP